MTFRELRSLIRSDLYRYAGEAGFGAFLKNITGTPGFKYSFWMRVCAGMVQHKLLRYSLFRLALLAWRHYMFKYGIEIPFTTRIGPWLYIGHFGGIVVSDYAVIGRNCNLSPGVVIGQSNRGEKKGYPVIGDSVYIGPGAKIIGGIMVGSQAAIGANCVVVDDVPENAVVAGVPGRVISHEGSRDYINHTDY